MRLTLYQSVHSPLHGMDPRVKLFALTLWCVGILFYSSPYVLIWPFLGLAVLAVVARVLRVYAIGALVIVAMGSFAFLVWPIVLTLQGHGGVAAWVFGLGMGLRVMDMLLAGMLLLLTSRTEELLAAFSRLGFPYPAVFSLGLTFRLVPALLSNALHVVEAQRLRGLRFDEGGLITRTRRYLPLLVPILACSLRSAHQMSWALEAKGFGSQSVRVPFIVLAMRPGDWVALVITLGLFVVCFLARFGPWAVL